MLTYDPKSVKIPFAYSFLKKKSFMVSLEDYVSNHSWNPWMWGRIGWTS